MRDQKASGSSTLPPVTDRATSSTGGSGLKGEAGSGQGTAGALAADAWLAAIVEGCDDAIIGKDLDGIVTSWNPAAERLFGYAGAEIIGRPISILAPPGRENEMPAILDRLRRGERVERYETMRRRKNGRLVEVSLTVSPVRDPSSGQIVGASKIARDITERKRAEEVVRMALQERQLALRELNHRVKNTLQLVSSLLRLQAARITDEVAAREFDRAHRRIDAVARTHAALYQGDEGKVRTADFGALLRELCESLSGMLVEAGEAVAVRVETDEAQLPADTAIPLALIANELVTNALKHAFPLRRGEVSVAFRVDPDGRCRLVVADTGQGLPESEPEDGLGLRLVRALVGQLGSKLTVENRPGLRITVAVPPRDRG